MLNNGNNKKIPPKILIEYLDGFIKIRISEDITISEFVSIVSDNNILINLSGAVINNNDFNELSEGLYYIKILGNRIYNIFESKDGYVVDIKTFYHDCIAQKTIYLKNDYYSFETCVCDRKGILKSRKYYSSINYAGNNNISEEEAQAEIQDFINQVGVINNVIDVQQILRRIKNKEMVLRKGM